MKRENSDLPDKQVKIRKKTFREFGGALEDSGQSEDYWENVNGGASWMNSNENPAAMMYAIRTGPARLQSSDRQWKLFMEKSGALGHFVPRFRTGTSKQIGA